MDLMGVGASDYSSVIAQSNSKNVADKIENMKTEGSSDAEMLEACKEFEKYMLEQVYKSMEKTIDRAEEKSDYEEYFGDMMVQEYAEKAMDQGGMGLAQQLYEAMKHNEGDIIFTKS
ncbi:MAG: rod-binding protein [Lachnospiraceae bacterium]|nr:rod-binding protein [Lachnospiraceae bacterium]